MRNLKRALSLALATVMTLGLMVVGTGAVGYEDVASEDNVEAIEVLQAVGIMTGDENGNFNPDANVTRNEMAVIMSQLLNLNYDYYRGTNPFTDVPSWAAPYVAACAAEGVVAGIGDGLYGGENQVTAAQAALMILKALGYFQYEADFDGDWQVATIRQASYIRLFDGIDASAEEALTRNQIAQLVLNGLKSSMVTFTGEVGITVNGVTLNHRTEYTARTSADAQYDAIVGGTTDIAPQGQYLIQLGEELYDGDLRLQYTTDDFGRPARYWEYDGEEIGTYIRGDLLRQEYTEEVTGRDLYDLLGKSTIDEYDFFIYVDGEEEEQYLEDAYFTEGNLVRSNTNGVGETGNGVLTQVFVDTSNKDVYITVINTYLAKTSDYDDKKDEIDLDVYSLDNKGTSRNVHYVKDTTITNEKAVVCDDFTVSGDDFAIADYVSGDIVLVTVAAGEIQTLADPEVISDATVDAFKLKSYVESEGTQYDYADVITYDPEVLDQYSDNNLKDITYDLILDPYGYLIGIKQNQDPDQYLFLTAIDTSSSNFSGTTAEANVIFMDGTMATIDINARNSKAADKGELVDDATATMNTWCKYTVNSSDVYTLTEVGAVLDDDHDVAQNHDTARTQIDKSHISLTGAGSSLRVYGNDETVYLVAELDKINSNTTYGSSEKAVIIDDVASVVTGVENADIEVFDDDKVEDDYSITKANASEGDTTDENISYGVYALYDDESYVIGAVVVGEDAGSTNNFVYVISENANRESYSSADDEYTWTRPVALDGEENELTYVGDALEEIGKDVMDAATWQYVRYYADGTVKDAVEVPTADTQNWKNGYDVMHSILEAVKRVDEANEEHVLLSNAVENDLTFKNGTLYSDDSDDMGIWISPDVKVVRIQNVDNDQFGEIEYYDGRDGLEDALDDMIVDEDDNILVSAIIEDGAAMVVVLNNTNDEKTDEGDKTPATGGKYSRVVDTTAKLPAGLALSNASVDNNGDLKMPYVVGENIYTQMEDALTALGYTDIEITRNAGDYNATARNEDGYRENVEFTPSTDGTDFYTVTIDEKLEEYVQEGGSTTTLKELTGDGEGFIHKMGDAAWAYIDYGADEYGNVNGHVEALTGYVDASGVTKFDVPTGWTTTSATPDYLTAGDEFTIVITRSDTSEKYDETDFGNRTWGLTINGNTDFDYTVALTKEGTTGTGAVNAEVTYEVTIDSVDEDVTTIGTTVAVKS